MPIPRIEADQYRWIRLHDDSSPLYTVDYEQTVLGYDRDAGTSNEQPIRLACMPAASPT